jgi:hypothetical protein
VHSNSKIQPTTSPTFVFSVSASVRKKWGYERKTVVLVVVHRVFYSHFIISLKKYDTVAKTFLYIIIILCYGWLQKKRELSEKVLSDFIKYL